MALKRTKRLDAERLLPEVIHRLLSISDGDVLLREVCGLAKEALGADEVAVLLVDPAGHDLVEYEVVGGKLRAGEVRLRLREEGIVGWVAAHRLPQVVADVRKDKRYVEIDPSTRSEAAVPILADGKVWGVLDFQSRHRGFFQQEDLPLLEFLATQLAIALRMGELDARVRRWQERLGALHNISRLGGGVVPVATMLQRAVDTARRMCGGHYAAVYRGDDRRKELVLMAQSSARWVPVAVGARQKFGTGLAGRAFELGETVNVRNVRRDPMYVEKIPGILSQICVPILVGDRSAGILDAQAEAAGEFTPDEAIFLETLASFLAPVLSSGA